MKSNMTEKERHYWNGLCVKLGMKEMIIPRKKPKKKRFGRTSYRF